VIGQASKEIRALLDEGQEVRDVREGLARWHQAAKHPSTLASFVNEVMNASPQAAASRGRASNGRGPVVGHQDEWKVNRA
jgi:hypothetical protein